jgi:thiamine-phosphate pyrophosphorylase
VIATAIETLMPIAHKHEVAFILNDDPDRAAKYDCDGVHVGQDDMTAHDARKVIGDDKILGVTCHDSKHLAMEAGEAGADYVAFGAFYDTQTKQAKTQASPDILTFWQEFVELPCVAIGGITPDNAAPLAEAGADFIAASAGVWHHADGAAAAIAAFNHILDAAHKKGSQK